MSGHNSQQEFWDLAAEIVDDEELMNKTDDIWNDTGMIKAIKPFFNWTPPTLNDKNSFKKSSAKSMKYAEEAIKAANDDEVGRSFKLANMITAFAQDAGDLALGHLIRFLLYDQFEMYKHIKKEELELYLKSPQQAKQMRASIKLKILDGHGHGSIPPNQSKKELTRFLKELRAEKENKSAEVKKSEAEEEKQKEKKRQFTRDVHTLKSPNPMAPALEDFVEIKYDSVKGRLFVVTKDVPAGTTVFVEKPFVAGLGNVFELEINRCHHCFKVEFTPIPCPNCVFVLYCSEKCVEESKEYHSKFECSAFPGLYPILSHVKANYSFLIAFSAICTFGPHEVFRVFQKQQQELQKPKKSEGGEESSDFVIPGVDPETGIYESSSFETILHMRETRERSSTVQVLIAMGLTKILETRTNFFEQLELEFKSSSSSSKPKKVKSRFRDFITLSIVSIYNSYGIYECEEPEYFDYPCGAYIKPVVSLEPTHKLSNHSCYGNIGIGSPFNLKQMGTLGLAEKDLKEGEEICRVYEVGGCFLEIPKHVRQAKLLKEFHFKCECVACLNDWPLMKELEAEKDRPKFCCPLCSSKIPPQPEMMSKENYEKIALNSGNNFICLQCKSEYKEAELMSQFKRHSMALKIAENLIKTGVGEETLKSLRAASSFFQNHLIPPSFYQIKCGKLIPQAITHSLVIDLYD